MLGELINRTGRNTLLLILIISVNVSCKSDRSNAIYNDSDLKSDSLEIIKMISIREKAMINKDVQTAIAQFSEQVSWINSQGYFFEGKDNVSKFHNMLTANDTLDYYYEAGQPRIRIIDAQNAIAYYSWKMFWYKRDIPADTTFKEIGLMTLTAHKKNKAWRWIAITNQHTPWFYEQVLPVTTD